LKKNWLLDRGIHEFLIAEAMTDELSEARIPREKNRPGLINHSIWMNV
jgi:hypothetical protein